MYPGKWAEVAPDHPAAVLTETSEQLTYAELNERSAKLANWFRAQGLERGDVVALLATNSLEHFEVYWAAMRSGLYLTTINYHLLPSEVSYILSDSGARVLIASGDLEDLAVQALGAAPKVEKALSYKGSIEGFSDYATAYADQPATEQDDDRAGRTMLYSSGTTGKPKGVRVALPETSVKEDGDGNLMVAAKIFGFDQDTRYLSPAPLYHAAPLRYSGQIQVWGGTVYVMPRFDASIALELIERYQITHSQWVPTMFVRMLKLPEAERAAHDVSSLKVAIHAAAPCPQDVKREMINWWGPILWEYYAGSEGNGLTIINSEQWLEKPGSVGKAATNPVHICDQAGRELPTGEVGTVFFESEKAPFDYHNDPDKTASSRHPSNPNWTTIGDLGSVDEDGFLFLAERQSFVIISGGVNIYPQEVEDAITMHPSVADVAVIGVDDEEMGEQVKAVIELVPGVPQDNATREALLDHLASRIAKYKMPKTIDFIDELPRTATGKLRKHQIRQQYQG